MAEAFTWGSGGEKLSPSERRRRVAEAMMQRGMDTSPVQHWTQGAARVAQALMGGWEARKADEEEKAGRGATAMKVAEALNAGAAPPPAVPPMATASVQPGSGDPQNALDAIMKFESSGRNVHQNVVPAGGGFNPSTGTVTGPSSASGYFQMINPTWKSAAAMAGVDTSQYPTAMSAPYDLQRKAASALYAKEGFAPWAPYNAALRAHIAKSGGAGAFTNDGAGAAQAADLPAPGASPAAMETGAAGFVPPQAAMPEASAALMPAPPQPQADLPASGASPAMAVATPPLPAPDLSNENDAGSRAFAATGGGVNAPAGDGASIFDRIAAAIGGRPAPQPAPSSPGVARVAAAVPAPAEPSVAPAGVERTALPPPQPRSRIAAAMEVLNSPYATAEQKAAVKSVIERANADPNDARLKQLQVRKLEQEVSGEKLLTPEQEAQKVRLAQAGRTQVNVNGGGSDKQVFDAFAENTKEARAAATGLIALREARGALQGGAITGAGADTRLALQKIAAGFGGDPSKVVNTETFRAAIAPQVAAVLKSTVGSANISDADRRFAEKASGGSIDLDEGSINRLLDIMEKAGEARLSLHRQQLDAVYPDPEGNKRERALFSVAAPPKPERDPNVPVRVRTPDEARKLPSGTKIILPDGTEGRVP